jgi:hypothetical protein
MKLIHHQYQRAFRQTFIVVAMNSREEFLSKLTH